MPSRHSRNGSTSVTIRKIRFPLTQIKMAFMKNTNVNKHWNGGRETGTLLLVGVWINAASMEICLKASQRTKNRAAIWPNYTTLGYIPKGFISCHRDNCRATFIAALFTVAKNWKQPRCHFTGERVVETRHINTVKFYSALKKTENYEACKKMDGARNIIPNYVTRTWRVEYHMLSYVDHGLKFLVWLAWNVCRDLKVRRGAMGWFN